MRANIVDADEILTAEKVGRALEAQKRLIDNERRAQFESFGVPSECLWPASRVYHEHSELGPAWAATLTVEEVDKITRNLDYKRYPNAERFALPPTQTLEAKLEQAIRERHSTRDYAPRSVPLNVLAKLLELGDGVTKVQEIPRRAAPSAGALYPVESYVIALAVDGLEPGIYHYVPIIHELERLRPIADICAMEEFLPPDLLKARPPIVLVLTAVFSRVQTKYLERGYRFALLEAGHISQNLMLTATALGLGSLAVGGFWDEPFNEFLGLDSTTEAVLYALLAGYPDDASGG